MEPTYNVKPFQSIPTQNNSQAKPNNVLRSVLYHIFYLVTYQNIQVNHQIFRNQPSIMDLAILKAFLCSPFFWLIAFLCCS